MKYSSSTTVQLTAPLSSGGLPRRTGGPLWGFVGVAAFSLTVPLTRIAVRHDAMSPLFVGAGRAVLAATLAALLLAVTRTPIPSPGQWRRIAVVAAGVVLGFPLMTTFALSTASAGHGAVVIALLPAVTALVAVARTREHPPRRFWVCAALGAGATVAFAVAHAGAGSPGTSDLLLLGAVIAAAVGYAEGGLLATRIGAWQTISWALVLASPVMVSLTAWSALDHPPSAAPTEWAAFGYLGAVSMFLGFFAWYRGLAIGPMTRVSQIQLVQPVLSIAWAAVLLGEHLTWGTTVGAIAIIGFALAAVRARTSPPAAVGARTGSSQQQSGCEHRSECEHGSGCDHRSLPIGDAPVGTATPGSATLE
ncbi:EamA family transporter [Gordonia pseudamarae]|uniref:EamA family transporter n=1 Tax=Gordonia pseudamarae TaxID=2831662 RepID=A0ABX6IJQ1_9ACTN|nr:DMT family transporter [Gordonia sp. (in: high G+C Gram-positive bacteria)]QHN26647.1 EamA family transporter [Gordonia pseudamarae]QHN35540.1 EamA family transporter [Gordonia pseudamarae]